MNIYTGHYVDLDDKRNVHFPPFPPGFPRTTMGRPVLSESLYWGLKFLYQRYACPLYVTENGMGDKDWVHLGGRVADLARIDYLQRYLKSMGQAVNEGVDVKGHFLWPLMDNLEWAYGYEQRFGIIHVDFQRQKRTLKDSAHRYRQLIKKGGQEL